MWSLASEDSISHSESVAAVETESAKGDRAPASIHPGKIKKPAPFTQFDLKCTKKATTGLVVNDHFMQIQGKNCLKSFNVEKLEIVNKSNGYTASIFATGLDQYQTDLIQLKNGDNEIVIRYSPNSGIWVEEVLKVRAPQI